jgi:hypothetical protein
MNRPTTIALSALLGAALAGGVFWWQGRHAGLPASPPPAVDARTAPVAAAPAAASGVPPIHHPMPPASASAAVADQSLDAGLLDLFGREAIASLFRTDGFAQRFVATVDNLGRSAAPAGVWPMNPAPGRFETGDTPRGEVMLTDNGLRYVPYVLLLERVDLARAVRLYELHYPELQRAYEDLGFPHGYFNDRLVDVLDRLLATPEAAPPVRVHRPVTDGVPPARPWLMYEFDDPTLQDLSAGQRILIRMGPVNERRVKTRLAAFRKLLVQEAAGAGG